MMVAGRHKKKEAKKFAMIFPLIATFKFILIKALLVPILLGIIAIKKMLVVAAMAIPAIFTMIRLCRWGGFGIGPLTAAAAAAAPLMSAPMGATAVDIIGDFSHNAPSAMAVQYPSYYNNRQQSGNDYNSKSLPPFNGPYSGNYYE